MEKIITLIMVGLYIYFIVLPTIFKPKKSCTKDELTNEEHRHFEKYPWMLNHHDAGALKQMLQDHKAQEEIGGIEENFTAAIEKFIQEEKLSIYIIGNPCVVNRDYLLNRIDMKLPCRIFRNGKHIDWDVYYDTHLGNYYSGQSDLSVAVTEQTGTSKKPPRPCPW